MTYGKHIETYVKFKWITQVFFFYRFSFASAIFMGKQKWKMTSLEMLRLFLKFLCVQLKYVAIFRCGERCSERQAACQINPTAGCWCCWCWKCHVNDLFSRNLRPALKLISSRFHQLQLPVIYGAIQFVRISMRLHLYYTSLLHRKLFVPSEEFFYWIFLKNIKSTFLNGIILSTANGVKLNLLDSFASYRLK